ncbi:hypothetical protein QJS04_geneDACA015101 [Acorus gramineus]|uniref:Uncharacterized protein n=1 Tax=Acorus gramineus TaxID=55184 RepID=A0AAV9BR22_ACOGR|nr:hypothetical protein QJS04_geneDACA015101 [Acorus gramineus]
MFRLVRRNVIDIVIRRGSTQTHPLKSISTTSEDNETYKTPDFMVSYFMNTYGLSSNSALKASKSIRFKTTEKPDSVLLFLKNQGFTNTQIAKLVSIAPRLVLSNPDKILKPKMDFLRSAGFSTADLTHIISKNPTILICSLEKQLVTAIGYLKGILGTDKDVISTIKRSTWILNSNLPERMGSKIAVLRDHGVPDYRILAMIKQRAGAFLSNSDRFSEALIIVKDMGFDPSSSFFFMALANVVGTDKSKWVEKMELYKSFGWSQDDIVSAFKKQPQIMVLSKEKITRMMDFFVKESGLGLSFVSRYPDALLHGLEKRIMRRYSVTRVLISHGLLNKDVNYYTIFKLTDAKFLDKYVIKYQENADLPM